MKIIKYHRMLEINHGTEEAPGAEQMFTLCEIRCGNDVFDSNYAIAQSEACGEITVEEIPDPVTEPTLDERNRADIDYIALMTGIEL